MARLTEVRKESLTFSVGRKSRSQVSLEEPSLSGHFVQIQRRKQQKNDGKTDYEKHGGCEQV